VRWRIGGWSDFIYPYLRKPSESGGELFGERIKSAMEIRLGILPRNMDENGLYDR